MKLTKKKLKELAETLDAHYYGGNVYDYESAIDYICGIHVDSVEFHQHVKSNEYYNRDILIGLVCTYKDAHYRMYATKIAYSCGIYGNSGQLHKIDVYDNDDKFINTFCVYYC